jgi:hypothetical protein
MGNLSIDNLDLPLSNRNEDLETISINRFKSLFPADQFEIRPETLRDKGIDMHVEIKKSGKYTNFRFAIQLKATDSLKLNSDDTFSLQIHTGNINYLLHSGMPAFYVLYLKQKDEFLYEDIADFIKDLNNKDSEWNTQPAHTLRFKKKLTKEAVDEMYEKTVTKGRFQREINERVALKTALVDTGDKILFDANFNISDDAEIRKLVEAIGLELINETKWNEILLVHKKASNTIASTAKYNLVLGIANYYAGNLIDALSFFKLALKLKSQLSAALVEHLKFFELSTRFSLGLVDRSEYNKIIAPFENTATFGLYIKLDNVKRKYAEDTKSGSDESYYKLVNDINVILKDPACDKNIELTVKCDMILLEGTKFTLDYVKNVSWLNATEQSTGIPNIELRKIGLTEFIQAQAQWQKNVDGLKKEAIDTKNYFAYYTAIVNEIQVVYMFMAASQQIKLVMERPGVHIPMPDKPELLQNLHKSLDKAIAYYNTIGHIENLITASAIKYQIFCFQHDSKAAQPLLTTLQEIAENYEMADIKRKLNYLKNGGTTHEKIHKHFGDISVQTEKIIKEIDDLIEEMKKMDEQERIKKRPLPNSYCISLFPIGEFRFPKSRLNEVLSILNIKEMITREVFTNFFEQGIVPVANIYYSEVIQEGPLNGRLADTGPECWRNIYRIRKAFYDNEFYRIERS